MGSDWGEGSQGSSTGHAAMGAALGVMAQPLLGSQPPCALPSLSCLSPSVASCPADRLQRYFVVALHKIAQGTS